MCNIESLFELLMYNIITKFSFHFIFQIQLPNYKMDQESFGHTLQ